MTVLSSELYYSVLKLQKWVARTRLRIWCRDCSTW
jgi:hypothetical protein